MSPETTTVHDETLYGGDDVDSCGNLNEDDADATERAVPVVGTTTTQLAAAQERQTLARKETRVVRTLRIVVLAVLWSTGALMAWATFAYTRRIEQDDFEASFAAASTAVLESFHEAMNQNFGSIDALSAAVTDHARSTHQIFPNVTFPGFHALAAATRVMTHAIYVFYIPIVTDDTRRSYEAYCREHQGYLFPAFSEQQTLVALQDERFGLEPAPLPGQRRLHFNLHEPHPTIHDEIFGSEGGGAFRPENSGPYFPVWQSSPIMPSYMPYNLDMGTIPPWDSEIKQAATTGKAVLGVTTVEAPQLEGGTVQDPEDDGSGSHNEATRVTGTHEIMRYLAELGQYRHRGTDQYTDTRQRVPGQLNGDPSCQMVYPIFDTFGQGRQVAALLVIEVFWHVLMQDVLPSDVKGVVVVFENDVGQVITYRIDGAHAGYLGQGDLHDTRYDDWGVTQNVAEYLRSRATPETQSVTFAELDDSFNNYYMTVYPSSDMEGTHLSNDPILFAIAIGCVFVFCSLVFLAFDCMVERRQRLVLNRAVQSTAVVSSLFPEKVRDRLMKEHTDAPKQRKTKQNGWNAKTADKSLAEFLVHSGELDNVHNRTVGKPIADHIDESTVLFADLVGFTKWSSTRKAEDVFELLETIFGAFDAVALRLKVFKVETVGDCYVAATGVPDKQDQHAVIMVRFARECLSRMRILLQDIRDRLGEDTVELNLRIGIHSGPITAGVLRGEKGRFQLFGDTINTASRMESNGRPGTIQVSEDTAELLRSAGKSHWLVQREDRVVAKGKGELRTYWVVTGAALSQRKTSSVPSVTSEKQSSSTAQDLEQSPSKGLHSQLYPQKLRCASKDSFDQHDA